MCVQLELHMVAEARPCLGDLLMETVTALMFIGSFYLNCSEAGYSEITGRILHALLITGFIYEVGGRALLEPSIETRWRILAVSSLHTSKPRCRQFNPLDLAEASWQEGTGGFLPAALTLDPFLRSPMEQARLKLLIEPSLHSSS